MCWSVDPSCRIFDLETKPNYPKISILEDWHWNDTHYVHTLIFVFTNFQLYSDQSDRRAEHEDNNGRRGRGYWNIDGNGDPNTGFIHITCNRFARIYHTTKKKCRQRLVTGESFSRYRRRQCTKYWGNSIDRVTLRSGALHQHKRNRFAKNTTAGV